MSPTVGNGKMFCIQIPSIDPERDCNFHKQFFDWEIRTGDDSVAATIFLVRSIGGEIEAPIGADSPEITARFRDLSGNAFGLYQEPS